MNHRDEKLSAFLDDMLDDDDRVECERALFTEPGARERYRSMRALRSALAEEPAPEPLPLRVDVGLARLAERFLAEEALETETPAETPLIVGPLEAPTFWNRGNAFNNDPELHERSWLHAATAVGLALLAVVGMGLFARAGGNFPALSSVEHRIHGLNDFGHEALYLHMDHSRLVPLQPVEPRNQLERSLEQRLDFAVTLPTDRIGEPIDARAVELDGESVGMADYAIRGVPVTMIALPRELGVERLGLEYERLPDACAVDAAHSCHTDARGTSICAQTDGKLVRIWVARLPSLVLGYLVQPHAPF